MIGATNSKEGSILFLTRYDRLGASSRYRFLQFLPLLEEAGFSCTVSPLLDDRYLQNRYRSGHWTLADLGRGLLRRIRALLSARSYDLLVIEKELLMYFPAVLERFLRALGIRYLVDYDDAVFHQYDDNPSRLVRLLLRDKISSVMRHACCVVAGNRYLASYARRAGAQRVETVPTVVDLDRYLLKPGGDRSSFVIGWIGSPSTVVYLDAIAPALAQVCAGGRGKVVLVGAGGGKLEGVPVQMIPWSEEGEVEEISRFDVGIMPLPDVPWARGKCGFKLIQYMACSLPVVASPVGVNCEMVEESNGFLATSCAEWVEALSTLRDNPALRRRMGEAGRSKAEAKYSLQVVGPRIVSIMRQAVGGMA